MNLFIALVYLFFFYLKDIYSNKTNQLHIPRCRLSDRVQERQRDQQRLVLRSNSQVEVPQTGQDAHASSPLSAVRSGRTAHQEQGESESIDKPQLSRLERT